MWLKLSPDVFLCARVVFLLPQKVVWGVLGTCLAVPVPDCGLTV